MNRRLHIITVGVLLTGLVVLPAQAQTPAGLTGDLLTATSEVEQKLAGLANALSESQYAWRPGEGVRSVGEVLLHVAADNYFLPAVLGVAAPAATKITASDYAAVQAYERQKLDRAATIAELTASFDHLKRAMAQVPESRMNEPLNVFGKTYTVRSFLLLATTHLHEHLGQMIAYARSNGVKPPWSR
jgi:uncharacterized damage-inducible protein DinB